MRGTGNRGLHQTRDRIGGQRTSIGNMKWRFPSKLLSREPSFFGGELTLKICRVRAARRRCFPLQSIAIIPRVSLTDISTHSNYTHGRRLSFRGCGRCSRIAGTLVLAFPKGWSRGVQKSGFTPVQCKNMSVHFAVSLFWLHRFASTIIQGAIIRRKLCNILCK